MTKLMIVKKQSAKAAGYINVTTFQKSLKWAIVHAIMDPPLTKG